MQSELVILFDRTFAILKSVNVKIYSTYNKKADEKLKKKCSKHFQWRYLNTKVQRILLQQEFCPFIVNSETSSTSSVWPNDHWWDYRSCAWPFYSLVQIIHLAWTIWRALSKPPQRRQGSWSLSPLIVSRDSFILWTWTHVQTARNAAYLYGCPYTFLIYYYITTCVCVTHFFYLSALVGCWSSVSIRSTFYKILNVCPFDYTAVAVSGKVERSKTGLTTPVWWQLLL